jgi:hypothetical protein
MTGARDLIDQGNGLSFRIGKNDAKATHVVITLNADDTYDMDFLRIRNHGLDIRTVKQIHGLYADNLCPAFEDTTGLLTRLF